MASAFLSVLVMGGAWIRRGRRRLGRASGGLGMGVCTVFGIQRSLWIHGISCGGTRFSGAGDSEMGRCVYGWIWSGTVESMFLFV